MIFSKVNAFFVFFKFRENPRGGKIRRALISGTKFFWELKFSGAHFFSYTTLNIKFHPNLRTPMGTLLQNLRCRASTNKLFISCDISTTFKRTSASNICCYLQASTIYSYLQKKKDQMPSNSKTENQNIESILNTTKEDHW